MPAYKFTNLRPPAKIVFAALIAAFALAACIGGSDDSSTPAGTTAAAAAAVVVTPYVPAPAGSSGVAVTAVALAGGGKVTITSANSLSNGDTIVISGTTSYNGTYTVSNVTGTTFDIVAAFVATETGFQQAVGTVAAPLGGCTTTGGGLGTIGLVATAARYSGVGPLAVFFDASGTTHTNGAINTFHDLEYRWNFGDGTSGNWAYGSRATTSSRNLATGPVAAHVYKSPGEYTVTLTITDGTLTVVNNCIQIAVQSPDVVFSGTKTVCLSKAGNFTNCPAGASQITDATGNFPAMVAAHVGSGKRLLFRAGETWDAATSGNVNTAGPGVIGSYGPSGDPIAKIRATADASAGIVKLSSATTPGLSDWRIIDLELDGNGNTSRIGVEFDGGMDQASLVGLNIHHVHAGALLSSTIPDFWNNNGNPGHTLWDQAAIADSVVTNITGSSAALSVYASGRRFMLLGNSLDNSGGGEHTVRLPSIVRGVISNNTMQGQGTSAGSKHAFTLRADVHGDTGVEGGLDTQYVVVSDNKFVGMNGSQWTVMYGPQCACDERVLDVITERNWITAAGGVVTGTQVGMTIFARQQTIRNNLFDMTGGKAHSAMLLSDGLTVGSNQVRVYHNTMFSNDADNDFAAVEINTGVVAPTVKNNLAYSPNDTQRLMVYQSTGAVATLVQSNNSDAVTQVRLVSPNFTATPPVTTADWKPIGGYAVGAGDTTVPVWSDFFAVTRPTPTVARDLGAVLP